MDVLLFRANGGLLHSSVATTASRVTTLENAQQSEMWTNNYGDAPNVMKETTSGTVFTKPGVYEEKYERSGERRMLR